RSDATTHPSLHSFPTRRSSDLQLIGSFNYVRVESAGKPSIGGNHNNEHFLRFPFLSKRRSRIFKACRKVAQNIFQLIRIRTQLRSEEHTSELQSRENLVCRLLL